MPNFTKINSKVVQAPVAMGSAVLARRGAMLAYTGDVHFSPVAGGQGVGGFVGRALSGENAPMMAAEGNGAVFYGHAGLHVTVVELDGRETLSVESDRLLAHDASISSSIVFLGQQGGIRGAVRGAMTGQGLFTTQLSGAGSVAVLSHGGTIALPVNGGTRVSVDPQSYVAHTGNVQLDIAVSASWRDAVGKGSGEAIQLRASGNGTVYVQASEQKF